MEATKKRQADVHDDRWLGWPVHVYVCVLLLAPRQASCLSLKCDGGGLIDGRWNVVCDLTQRES